MFLYRSKLLRHIKCYRSFNTLCVNGKEQRFLSRDELDINRAKRFFENKTISTIGYGPQGFSQSMNLRDQGFNVCVGVRKYGPSWDKAIEDGWIENKNLFDIKNALEAGDVYQYLVSDSAQMIMWDNIKKHLDFGKTLCFSHGFGITYSKLTKIIPPNMIDVIMVAPKGPGSKVREKFLKGNGVNASYAVYQNSSGDAYKSVVNLAVGIGCTNLFETTFNHETYSDLVGERCVLLAAIIGAFQAQYNVLIERGHSPLEAYNETVEEALECLYPLMNDKGADWMLANCSTTAQTGALEWAPKFENLIKPMIEECYERVKDGSEAQKAIDANKEDDYREKLDNQLKDIAENELWKVAKQARSLRKDDFLL